MREIKFRAWNLEKERWATEGEIEKRLFLNCSKQEEGCFELNELLRNGAAKDLGVYLDVMRFTGIHDKHGREVYEGDIINFVLEYKQFDLPKEKTFKIEFEDGSFCGDNTDWLVELNELLDVGEVTVIGNIHENPELLEG